MKPTQPRPRPHPNGTTRRKRTFGTITLLPRPPPQYAHDAHTPVFSITDLLQTTCAVSAIQSNINAWELDISDVNAFLNTASALGPSAVFSAAAAQESDCPGEEGDEGSRLAALTPCAGAAGASDAAQLGQIAPGVLGNLSIITESPNDKNIVDCALDAINYIRYVRSQILSMTQ